MEVHVEMSPTTSPGADGQVVDLFLGHFEGPGDHKLQNDHAPQIWQNTQFKKQKQLSNVFSSRF